MTWHEPKDIANRPIAILGAGVLGCRIACTWLAAGYNVHVRDPSSAQLLACTQYVSSNLALYTPQTASPTAAGTLQTFEALDAAVAHAWLAIEAIPETLSLKTAAFAQLEHLAPQDCILASNSSSYKSSEMLGGLAADATKRRVLNMHYYMPPKNMVVELMTDGVTEGGIFPFLSARLRETGARPYVARKESTGFIFNRMWAAVKREALMILAEGVAGPEEIDGLWEEVFVKGGIRPCRTMDEVGLDTVAFIERHYIEERGLPSEHTVDYLESNYISQGKLGNKSNAGGLCGSGKPEVS